MFLVFYRLTQNIRAKVFKPRAARLRIPKASMFQGLYPVVAPREASLELV